MAPVRVATLFTGIPAVGNIVLLTVPAQMTYILKEALLLNQGPADTVSLFAVDPVTGAAGALWYLAPMANNARLEWNGLLVLQTGHTLHLTNAVGACSVWLSGVKLPG